MDNHFWGSHSEFKCMSVYLVTPSGVLAEGAGLFQKGRGRAKSFVLGTTDTMSMGPIPLDAPRAKARLYQMPAYLGAMQGVKSGKSGPKAVSRGLSVPCAFC